MREAIRAVGTVSIFSVLDMKQFIAQENGRIFDDLRGDPCFIKTLRDTWLKSVQEKQGFIPGLDRQKPLPSPNEDIRPELVQQEYFAHPISWDKKGDPTREQIASSTGIFRKDMVEEYPWYRVDTGLNEEHPCIKKLQQGFPLLWRILESDWNIDIRPTPRGLFVVRLSRCYNNKTALIDIARHVHVIQGEGQYAEEVCCHFVQNHDFFIKGLQFDPHNQSPQDKNDLYNSYIVYHLQDLFDEMGAHIFGRSIRGSRPLQQALALLTQN